MEHCISFISNFLYPYVPQIYRTQDKLWQTVDMPHTRFSVLLLTTLFPVDMVYIRGRPPNRKSQRPRYESAKQRLKIQFLPCSYIITIRRCSRWHFSVILTKNSAWVPDHSYRRLRDVVARPLPPPESWITRLWSHRRSTSFFSQFPSTSPVDSVFPALELVFDR